MTLQDLIDELSALPAGARTAMVFVGNADGFIVRYVGGAVEIEPYDELDDEDDA